MHTYLDDLAAHYPHLSAAFARIPNGEAHLHRLQDLNATWQHMLLSGTTRQYTEVVVTEESPAQAKLPAIDTFDIIYAGGGLNLLNAAVMTRRYGLRVLVFDRFTVGAVHREWNISRAELQELLDVGLLTPEELESVIQREYRDGLVRFHPAHIQVPPSELHLTGVLDVAVDAEKLTALCMRKILETPSASPHNALPNVILHNTTFVRGTVQPTSGVIVDVTSSSGEQHSYTAHLLIDGMGSTSPIACQLNCGRPFSLVCPTVGTVARGYKTGSTPDAIDPHIGEVLVTTEDARNGRQLIWEAFPGKDDQVAIYLFHYTAVGDRVDLLELFDDFFQLLPTYKDMSDVEILKPVYGFIPAGYNVSLPWQRQPKVLAYDRVLSLGDAAAFQSPLTFCGFGSYVRNLRRITTLLALALQHNLLSSADLNQIRASEAVPAVSRAFSKFMIAKAETSEPAWQVNETLNVFCHVLNNLGPHVTSAFFKDRIGWLDYTRVVLNTPSYYPGIYPLTFRTLSLAETLGWLTSWLQLAHQSFTFTLYHLLKPLISLLIIPLMTIGNRRPIFAHSGLRLAILREAMEQVGRGVPDEHGQYGQHSQHEFQERSGMSIHRKGRWLSHLWPHG